MLRLRPSYVLAALVGALAGGCSGSDVGERPNVVVVVIDTLRADRLPFYGHDRDTAPFLGELAERGVVFERAWSTSSWTAPSTASLFTGLYPLEHGVTQGLQVRRDTDGPGGSLELNRIPSAVETLPEAMARLGYRTFGIADNPNVARAVGFGDGFDQLETFHNKGSDAVNDELLAWSDEIVEGDGPWFVYLHYMDPHFPYLDRAPYYERPPGRKPRNYRTGPRDQALPFLEAAYASEIRYCDERIREAFDLLGVDRETVVVVASDHGEELLQRSDQTQHGFKLFSELTRVPLVIVDPTRPARRARVSVNVSLVDVLPTLREILGDDSPPSTGAGRSLVASYADASPVDDDRAVFAMRTRLGELGGGELRAVVVGTDKLIERDPDVNGRGGQRYLFDLENDWAELQDLSGTQPERADQLRGVWDDFTANADVQVGERAQVDLDEDTSAVLIELGYVDGDE